MVIEAPSHSIIGRVMTGGPLTGLRVVDLTTTFLGPYCTLMLADLGADVIKIESPNGDIARNLGVSRNPGMGSVFLAANRRKRSVVLDLKNKTAREALYKLAATADVFVHNMRPSAAKRLGIDYVDIKPVRPDIIYCQAYGFGAGGPYEGRPAYDDIIQGMSGLASVQSSGKPEPEYISTAIADKGAGLLAVIGILGAVRWRDSTGEGQVVDIPMFESMAAFTLLEQMGGETFIPAEGPAVYARMVAPNRRPYKTLDGYICVVVYTDDHWQRFLEFVERAELLSLPRFSNTSARSANVDELYGVLAEELEGRSTEDWLEILERMDIPASYLNSVQDLFEDPHLAARSSFQVIEHPSEGRIRAIGPGIEFSSSPTNGLGVAPRLGEHTHEVLAEVGVLVSDLGEQSPPKTPGPATVAGTP